MIALLALVQQVAEPFRAFRTCSHLVVLLLRILQCFFLGARTITIWRPSSLGHCSTVPTSLRSASTRFSSAMPSSWCAISRPRNRSVTFVLSPSVRNLVRFLSLVLSSPSWVPGRNFTSLTWICFCLSFASWAFLLSRYLNLP